MTQPILQHYSEPSEFDLAQACAADPALQLLTAMKCAGAHSEESDPALARLPLGGQHGHTW